jgi:hypothetical protein
VEYFNYLGSVKTDNTRRTPKIKSSVAMAKAVFNKKKCLFSRKLNLNCRKKLVNATFGA